MNDDRMASVLDYIVIDNPIDLHAALQTMRDKARLLCQALAGAARDDEARGELLAIRALALRLEGDIVMLDAESEGMRLAPTAHTAGPAEGLQGKEGTATPARADVPSDGHPCNVIPFRRPPDGDEA
jgi:hypothetical protein